MEGGKRERTVARNEVEKGEEKERVGYIDTWMNTKERWYCH